MGGYNPGHLWNIKSKVILKPTQLPTAMTDSGGNLLTKKDDSMEHTKAL